MEVEIRCIHGATIGVENKGGEALALRQDKGRRKQVLKAVYLIPISVSQVDKGSVYILKLLTDLADILFDI